MTSHKNNNSDKINVKDILTLSGMQTIRVLKKNIV